MGFKKGDKVRCINDKPHYITFGKVYTALDAGEDWVEVRLDNGRDSLRYSNDKFELFREENIMYKSDLKAGHILEDANGDHWLIVNFKKDIGAISIIKDPEKDNNLLGYKRIDLKNALNQDLTYSKEYEEFSLYPNSDIIKVYDFPEDGLDTQAERIQDNYLDVYYRELLWERNKPIKMTEEEVSKALGYKVEVVK